MAQRDNLQEFLQEAFHTYQLYLECMKIEIGGIGHLPLLKWPDVAQSAISYAEAWENKNPLETRDTEEIKSARGVLRQDLCVAISGPIEAIYKSTREHVTKHIGKEPKGIPLSYEESWKFPVQYKNRLIMATNDLFKTLETMTGTKYPKLNKRVTNGSRS
jgi:hypothetical protein